MNFFERISRLLGISPPKQKSDMATISDLIELGRQARYQENYTNALDIFEKAVAIAESRQDATAVVVARLNIADTYIQMKHYDLAESLLIELKSDTKKRQHHTPLAYTLCLIGYLHQMRGEWDLARDFYQQGLAIAEKANADGASGRAKGHLASTYLHEGNASYAEHLLREALPLLDKSNDIELSSHFIGQYALTMIQLGRDVDGDRLLETALQRAQRLDFKTQVRHWHQVIAKRKLAQEEYSSAFHHYHNFLQLSPDPLPTTELYGLALSDLSKISRHLGQDKEALDYARQATKILSTLDSDTLSSHALLTMGLAMRANQRYTEALDHFKWALQADDELTIEVQLEIARTYMMSKQYEGAESIYKHLLEKLDEEKQIAQIQRRLGNLYQSTNQLDIAIKHWMKAYKLYDNHSNHNQSARVICDMAQAHYQLGNGKHALREYERGLMLLNSVDKETRGVVMANAAIIYADKGDVPTTESFFTESIEIARELNNTSVEALRRNNYAAYLIDIGHVQRAIVSLEHALKLVDSDKNPLYVGIFLDNLGLAYRALDKPDIALTNHQLAQARLSNEKSSQWHILNHIYLVEVHLDLQQIDKAGEFLPADEPQVIDVVIQYYLATARLYLMRNIPTEAYRIIEKAVAKAQSGYRQRLLTKALVLQSRIQVALNEDESAVKTWESAEKLLTLLQMSKPNPNWLHLPSDT